MGAIVFDACLEDDALWLNSGEGEGGEEVGENAAVHSV
jgi:hypothetical protein